MQAPGHPSEGAKAGSFQNDLTKEDSGGLGDSGSSFCTSTFSSFVVVHKKSPHCRVHRSPFNDLQHPNWFSVASLSSSLKNSVSAGLV